MKPSRHLLLVEDIPLQYNALKPEFEAADWQVSRAEDEESALRQLSLFEREGSPIDALAIDLGLPPNIDNPLKGGMRLIEKLRQQGNKLPILAYTALTSQHVGPVYAMLVARLLAHRASFIYLRPLRGDVSLANLLQLTWQGFVIISPEPADHLIKAIPTRPDPLNEQQWEILRLLSQDFTYRQVAEKTNAGSADTVKARLNVLRETLVAAGELAVDHTDAHELRQWYTVHHARYQRP